jgi:hypothetical protein
MNQPQALAHLRTTCVPSDPSDAALIAIWEKARQNIGEPIPKAGKPEILDLPPEFADRLSKIRSAPEFGMWFGASSPTFQLVEIDPLLTTQFQLDRQRSSYHCDRLAKPPGMKELAALCLPTAQPKMDAHIATGPSSVVLKSPSLNLKLMHSGVFSAPGSVAGVVWGVKPELAQVTRFNDRCYLSNGFHRCYGARLAGATHVPCVLREVKKKSEVTIAEDGSTFGQELLESANPPTFGHFVHGRAYEVLLRKMSRLIHVAWAEYVLPDE